MHLLFPDAKNSVHRINRLKRGFIVGLQYALIASLTIGVLGAVQAKPKPPKSDKGGKAKPPVKPDNMAGTMAPERVVLLFAPDTKGGVSEVVSDTITDVERGRLLATHLYRTINFSRSLPTVRLGMVEQSISQTDVNHPYDVDSKLKKLAQYSNYDMVLATTINDYQFDDKTNSVSIVMSIRMIDYSGEKPVVRSAGASMSSPENPTGNPRQEKIADNLVRSLTEKLMTDLLNPKPVTKPSAEGAAK